MATPSSYPFFQVLIDLLGGISPTDVSQGRAGVAVHETTPGASNHPSGPPFKERIRFFASAKGTEHSFEVRGRRSPSSRLSRCHSACELNGFARMPPLFFIGQGPVQSLTVLSRGEGTKSSRRETIEHTVFKPRSFYSLKVLHKLLREGPLAALCQTFPLPVFGPPCPIFWLGFCL